MWQVGELIGGSQREERLDYLEARLDDLKLNKDSYWWYLDLRRYGSGQEAFLILDTQILSRNEEFCFLFFSSFFLVKMGG